MNELRTIQVQSEFQDVLDTLRAMTRDKEMGYRLGVGHYILQRFFGGSASAYSSHDATKAARFTEFAKLHAAELAEFDLSETQLRRCVRAHVCHLLLPPGVRDGLSWSALLHISSLDESNQRARLAAATVAQHWTVAQVKAAVEQANQGRLWDADPDTPGLQLPPPKPPAPIQPGRLVTRSEKWTADLKQFQDEIAQIDPKRLSGDQRTRLRASLATLEQQIQELRQAVG